MTLWERVEALAERVGALESSKVPSGPPEHRDLVALDRHFDLRCDRLSQRMDAHDGIARGHAETLTATLRRLERLERHVDKLERGERPSVPGCQHDCAEQGTHRDCDLHMGRSPQPYDAVTLEEAVELLVQWATWQKGPLNRTKDFLARARVAPEKP